VPCSSRWLRCLFRFSEVRLVQGQAQSPPSSPNPSSNPTERYGYAVMAGTTSGALELEPWALGREGGTRGVWVSEPSHRPVHTVFPYRADFTAWLGSISRSRFTRSSRSSYQHTSFRCLRNGFDRAEKPPLQSRRGLSPSAKEAGGLER
jgi:hypothetical protein